MKNLGYYNGTIDLIENITVPMNDRACYFGDGLFEVTYTRNHIAYSVEEHMDRMYAAAEELVKALLRYGTAAQSYFGENTDAPADAILDEGDRALGEHKDGIDGLASFTCTGNVTGVEYVSTTLELRDGTTMYHYFTVTEGVEYTVTCATAMLDCALVDGRVAIKVLDIDAANLATTYTLTLANGAETLTVSANAFAYARAVLASESASPALKTLMNALYEYYAAAAAYNA